MDVVYASWQVMSEYHYVLLYADKLTAVNQVGRRTRVPEHLEPCVQLTAPL